MATAGAAPQPANQNRRKGCGFGVPPSESNRPTDEVTFLTAPLFAKATKNNQSTAREQEEELNDVLVLIRHGERQDHADRAWKGSGLLPLYDPPLSNAGRMQSLETALKYYALRQDKRVEQRVRGTFSLFLVSPFHRCIETAVVLNIIAFGGKLPMFVDPLLSDWQQAKVFRNAPVLGGSFECCSSPDEAISKEGGDRLVFHPQREALRTTLVPFLKTKAVEETKLLEEYGISADVALTWAATAEQWLDWHGTLPVWTCASVTADIEARTHAGQECPVSDLAAKHRGAQRRGGRSPLPPPVTEPGAGDVYRGCGAGYPESKSDLLHRCELLVSTHYLRSATAQSEAMVPQCVRAAAAAERKMRLPKYFQTCVERPASDRDAAGPPALLPPTHVMAVTHADVVSTVLEVCCPKYHDKGAGYSVPYCSITTLRRHNNYYRIPPLEERQRNEAASSALAAGQQRGKGYPKKRTNAMPSKNQLSAPLKSRAPPPPLPVDWCVESVGSTDLLRTKIVIQYSK